MQNPLVSSTLMMGFTCCALVLVLGVLALGLVVSFQKRKYDKADKEQKDK